MSYGLTLVTPPLVEPVTLDQAKSFCTVSPDFTQDDDLINGFISAARVTGEKYCRRAFFNQTWKLTLDHFPLYWNNNTVVNRSDSHYPYQFFFDANTILLPKPRCVSVDSITYRDQNGTTQTLDPDSYFVDTDSEPARLVPANTFYWPTTLNYIPGSVKITYTCGSYGDGLAVNTCPANVQTAVSLLAAHFYANREGNAQIPDAFYRLLDSERHEVFGYGY